MVDTDNQDTYAILLEDDEDEIDGRSLTLQQKMAARKKQKLALTTVKENDSLSDLDILDSSKRNGYSSTNTATSASDRQKLIEEADDVFDFDDEQDILSKKEKMKKGTSASSRKTGIKSPLKRKVNSPVKKKGPAAKGSIKEEKKGKVSTSLKKNAPKKGKANKKKTEDSDDSYDDKMNEESDDSEDANETLPSTGVASSSRPKRATAKATKKYTFSDDEDDDEAEDEESSEDENDF